MISVEYIHGILSVPMVCIEYTHKHYGMVWYKSIIMQWYGMRISSSKRTVLFVKTGL